MLAPSTGRVPRFHLDAPLGAGSTCELGEAAAHHAIHVLRLHPGDAVTLFNGRGGEFGARIASIGKKGLSLEVLEHRAIERESPLRMVLVQGVSSGERMEFTIRKAVELGVAEIQPLLALASVARPKGERALSRQAHWQKIAIAACEQCGRNTVPKIQALLPIGRYRPSSGETGKDTTKILLSPRAERSLSQAAAAVRRDVVLAAGPEAGFDGAEEAGFAAAGFVAAKLGPRILRTETAALAALAALSALRGDF
ncbi:MAG TPA: 16S rRNA (uracil(1498)-N(3))-methyltransferase [Burkholderiales bacterium]|nr:16S rRNA (uracil(1498)-N(3))-methyltransferase [Burkholderiales bacterium]